MKPLKMVSIVLLSLLSLTAGCGKNTESYSTDVSDELSSGGIEEVADSISDGSTGQTTSMLNTALTSVNPLTNDFTLTRACTASGGVATVNVTFSGSKSLSLSGPNFTIANEVTVSGTRQRVWTPPAGQTVECTVNGYFASIPWTNDTVMNGLSLTDTFNRTRNVTRTFTKKADNTTKTRTDNFSATGTRTTAWSTGSSGSGTITRTLNTTSSVTRTKSYTKADGTSGDISMSVSTKSDAPIVVDVVRSSTNYVWITKTIKSGTMVAVKSGGGRVETAFNNVVFTKGDNSCLPTSGTINGSYFETESDTTASHTFTITFGADTTSQVSISRDGEAAVDFDVYSSKGCDLDVEG
jgi:hypothetical protein